MQKTSYARYRFPPVIIRHAVWLYFRFPLSYRDIEDLLSERGIEVTYETIRRWSLKFGLGHARKLRRSRPRPDHSVARIAFAEAVWWRPGKIVILRQKSRVLADSRR